MRILLLIDSLKAGGAERVISRLANYWATSGHDVAVVTIVPKHFDAYALNLEVERIDISFDGQKQSKIRTAFKHIIRAYRVWKTIRDFKPDNVISFMTYMNLRVLSIQLFLNASIIISERSNINKLTVTRICRIMRRLFYPWAYKIVFVSKGVSTGYGWLSKKQTETIYNPIEQAAIRSCHIGKNEIITLGRIEYNKGHDLLIKAFAKIASDYPDWTLRIIGEGKYRSELESIIAQNDLSGRIFLPGHSHDPLSVLALASIFAFSSRYEGFPNALIEAMSIGMPVISYDCPHGPNEIITHEHDGLLVETENVVALANAMRFLIDHPEERERLGQNALAINERLNIATIAAQWEALFHRSV